MKEENDKGKKKESKIDTIRIIIEGPSKAFKNKKEK